MFIISHGIPAFSFSSVSRVSEEISIGYLEVSVNASLSLKCTVEIRQLVKQRIVSGAISRTKSTHKEEVLITKAAERGKD